MSRALTPVPPLELELKDCAGQPVRLSLSEAEAVHMVKLCAQHFGWHSAHNPLLDDFMKSFRLSLDIAEKVEGGG